MKSINRKNITKPSLLSFSFLILLSLIIATLLLSLGCNGDDPEARPGASWDGSAKWAAQIAKPTIDAFSADVKIYVILGTRIYKDGRLPKNLGDWSIHAWSSALKKTLIVTIDHNGSIITSVTNDAHPPSSFDPLPADWITNSSWCNSTEAFAAIPNFPSNIVEAPEVSFNQIYCSSDQSHRNQPQWQILLNDIMYSHYILYNGQYLGYCHL